MRNPNNRSWGHTLITSLTTAALVATLLPAPALAASADEGTAPADEIVLLGDGAEAIVDASAAEEAEAAATVDAAAPIEPCDEAASDQAPALQAAPDQADKPATADADEGQPRDATPDAPTGTPTYIKRGWDGKKVTESIESCDEARPLPDDGKLDGGWYVLDADRAYKDRMEVTGDTHLILGDGHELTAKAGVYVAKGATLSIYSGPNETGTLIANAKKGAGIGAYSGHKGGNITIYSGRVEATAGKNCAGIGSNDGNGSDTGKITIYGGEVTATGGNDGAGIGGGNDSRADVTIYGGTVTANGKQDGAGIGSGEDSDNGTVTIHGGTVTANADTQGAGIGGGNNGDGGTIEITGGEVHANSGGDGAAIGGGESGDSGTITISGGTVNALGAKNGAGIGGGNHSGDGETISIYGGTVTAESVDGAGIGGGRASAQGFFSKVFGKSHNSGNSGTITISGGDATITSKRGFGIGAGSNSPDDSFSSRYIGNANKITIFAGTVTAKGRIAGMGGDNGTVDINGGNVTATGYMGNGAGIYFLDGDAKVNIRGGHTDIIGLNDCGIDMTYGPDVTISGGEVSASGNARPAIGSGYTDSKGTLAIKGKDTHVHCSSSTEVAIGSLDTKATGKVVVEDGATLVADSSNNQDGRVDSISSVSSYQTLRVKTLKLYDEAKVIAGASEGKATTQPSADRVKACKNGKTRYVAISPCDHPNATHEAHESGHTMQCPNCASKFSEAEHSFDEHHNCTVCGFKGEFSEPFFEGFDALDDGRIGLRLQLALPKGDFDRDACFVEFKVAGKDGKTATVPFGEMAPGKEDTTFFADCPLTVIQMADQVSATLHYGDGKTITDTYSLAAWIADVTRDSTDSADPAVRRAQALADLGHYTQAQLAAKHGFTLGKGRDHEPIEPATAFDRETLGIARGDAVQVEHITIEKCDTVSDISAACVLGSETSVMVHFVTDEQVEVVTIDGQPAPDDAVQQVSDGYVVTIDNIRADQLAEPHEIALTTTGTGGTMAMVSKLSPVTYAESVLTSSRYERSTKTLYAACALIRYWQAAQAV